MKIRPNPFFPVEQQRLSRELGVLWRELATSVNELVDAYLGTSTGGGGGGNRWGSGVDTTDDIIIDNSDAGLVLKSPDGHYWRVQVTNLGALTTTDLGTTKP
jgi:hypothetical protein